MMWIIYLGKLLSSSKFIDLFYPMSDKSLQCSSCFEFGNCYFQTSTNALREQLNVHRPAQTTLDRSNVLAMTDTNLMKMDLHAEVTMLDIVLGQCSDKMISCLDNIDYGRSIDSVIIHIEVNTWLGLQQYLQKKKWMFYFSKLYSI